MNGPEPGIRARITGEASAAIEFAVRILRFPLLVAALAPCLPAAALLLLSIGGSDAITVVAVFAAAIVGLATLILLWRRHRMLAAVDPPAALGRELSQAFDVADAWGDIDTALREINQRRRNSRGAFRNLRSLFSTLMLGNRTLSRFTEHHRLAPFAPPALALTWYIVLACLALTAVISLFSVVVAVLLLFGAW